MREASQSVQLAYVRDYAELEAAVFSEWNGATVFDGERVMQALAANLFRFRRSAGDGFTRWATAWVRRQARRYRFLAELAREYSKLIRAAATRAMYCCGAEDDAVDVADSEQALYSYLLANPRVLDALMRPGIAKASTRVYALAASRERGRRTLLTNRFCKYLGRLPGRNAETDVEKLVAV